jgi:hypothetical protein
MKRIHLCCFTAILFTLFLCTTARPCSQVLVCDHNSNVADAHATDWMIFDTSGEVSGQGAVSQVPGPAEGSQVLANIGFRVSGTGIVLVVSGLVFLDLSFRRHRG